MFKPGVAHYVLIMLRLNWKYSFQRFRTFFPTSDDPIVGGGCRRINSHLIIYHFSQVRSPPRINTPTLPFSHVRCGTKQRRQHERLGITTFSNPLVIFIKLRKISLPRCVARWKCEGFTPDNGSEIKWNVTVLIWGTCLISIPAY